MPARHRLGCAAAIVTVALAGAADALSRADPLPVELARAAEAYDRAQVTGDRAMLERLVADDYVLVNSNAHVEGKADLIAGYTTPGSGVRPFRVVDKVQKVFGDAALLAGRVRLEGLSSGKPFVADLRYVDVWRRRNGEWKVVFTEVTKVPRRGATR